ncbi:MAG: class I SAM-dependent methyltransferase [Rhodopirellula sp. JB044]|uniref:class I SAM-dependent methyltransferase n=1 Tax=Rhodopirellula sp. JB044 TaxID=3342844 RepID=UPI00370B75D6
MTQSSFEHRTLGEITPDLRARLAELCSDPASKSNQDSFTSAQRAVLIDIASLQVKAKRTFGETSEGGEAWWVTRGGLQQSTHHRVARLKASWMGDRPVVDLCCGLGSDTIALARRGITTGVDIDTDVLSFTQANLDVAEITARLKQSDVETAAIEELIGEAEGLHIDPDRRADGQRHTNADDLVPSWDRVEALMGATRGGLIKLAPATKLSDEQSDSFHRTWIGTGGSVREQTVLFGDVLQNDWVESNGMRAGGKSAITIRSGIAHVYTSAEDSEDRSQSAAITPAASPSADMHSSNKGTGKRSDIVGQWIIDPDAAIPAAGLTESFARSIGARVIGAASGFLTCDSIDALQPWASLAMAARVVEVVGCDDRKLRRCFRARKAFPDLIKVRGHDLDPAHLSRKMQSCGDQPLGLWIGRCGKRTYAAITEHATFPGGACQGL